MNCLEIDLSNQSLETLESFLLSSSKDRKWMNNVTCTTRPESPYGWLMNLNAGNVNWGVRTIVQVFLFTV